MAAWIEGRLDKQDREWLDTPIPALGGKTPREACKDPAGRKHIKHLILTMPPSLGPGGTQFPPPRDWMLRELGLEA